MAFFQTWQRRTIPPLIVIACNCGADEAASVKLRVRVTPNARISEVIAWEDDMQVGRILRIRVAAPPVEGKANEELRNFLAKALNLPKSKVLLEKGGSSRIKSFEIPEGTKLPW